MAVGISNINEVLDLSLNLSSLHVFLIKARHNTIPIWLQ